MRVLIVDDDQELAESIASELKFQGLETFTAKNAIAGAAVIDCQGIDVVISDVGMPKMDGLAFVREIQKRTPDVRVFLMTGNLAFSQDVFLRHKGVEGAFEKPFSIACVMEKLRGEVV